MNSRWLAAIALLMLLPMVGCGPANLDSDNDIFRRRLLELRLEDPDPVRGLMVRLRSSKSEYRLNEHIMMYVTIENVSKADIPVYIEMDPGIMIGLRIHRTSEPKAVIQSDRLQVVRNAGNLAKVSHYVDLPPLYFVGLPIIVPANKLGPGEFDIIVEYRCELSSCLAKSDFTHEDLRLLGEGALKTGLWTGKALSNAVAFKIIEE